MSRGMMIALGVTGLFGVAIAAWRQGGLLGLPAVSSGVTSESAGFSGLDGMKRIDRYLRQTNNIVPAAQTPACAQLVGQGLSDIATGNVSFGLQRMRDGLLQCPNDLVLGNAFRMTLFQLKREALAVARKEGLYNARLPDHLRDDPIMTLAAIARTHPSREAKLQLALAWVDQMLLFPALEVKAPSSVEAVKILTEVLDQEPLYVPALFGRGLNHLHRPSRLVWPESEHVLPDAAVQDIGRCVAIGRQLNIGSSRLQATLALTLGDAYVKAGRLESARSWWQVAQNLDRAEDMAQAVRRRFGWSNETIIDQLEAELDRSRSELDRPLSDLSFMWN